MTTLTRAEVLSFVEGFEADLVAARKSLGEIRERRDVLTVRCVRAAETALLNWISGLESDLAACRADLESL